MLTTCFISQTLNAAYVEASTHKTPVSLNSAGLSTCILKVGTLCFH